MADGSVSTSERTPPSMLEGDSTGRIIDPDRGVPLRTPYAVSAVANTGSASDALSTTLLRVGPENGKELVKNITSLAAICVSADGERRLATSVPANQLGNSLQGQSNTHHT